MPRIPRYPEPTNEAFLPHGPRKVQRKRRPSSASRFALAMRLAQQVLADQKAGTVDYDAAGALGVVGLYILMHTWVYKVEPGDLLEPHAMDAATGAVHRLIKEFNGKAEYVYEFVRWTWQRERRQFKTRPAENTFRIGWRYQFCSRNLITDYRVALARQARLG